MKSAHAEALAARWYQAALNAGFVKAAEILAEYHRTGFGVEQSSSKYIEYLTRAAEAGCRAPCCSSGAFTCRGELLHGDRKKAQMWLDGAVRGGRLDGLKWLVRMFSGEYGGYVEESATIRYGEMMVERGTATALEKLCLGASDRPPRPDRQRGLALLEEAAALEEEERRGSWGISICRARAGKRICRRPCGIFARQPCLETSWLWTWSRTFSSARSRPTMPARCRVLAQRRGVRRERERTAASCRRVVRSEQFRSAP